MSISTTDFEVIWHPYTHQKNRPYAIPIKKAKGTLLYAENGETYIDAISSWWVNIHGHSHPYIAKRIYKQAMELEHVIFAGFTHQPAVELARRLIRYLPGSFSKIFYSDNGSTAVEVALKMSLQYWSNKGESNRKKIVAFNDSYHGDTFGAMSTSSRSIFNKAFDEKLFDVVFINTPTNENIGAIKDQLNIIATEICCFIYEPLLQGAGGMKMYSSTHLDELLQVLKKHEIICIADEVMTGFFRTGTMFASEQCSSKPDLICLSKGLTGGTMAMGITACSEKIYNAFIDDDKQKTLYHGHSFTANPLGCAASIASLDLVEKKRFKPTIEKIIRSHTNFVAQLKKTKYAGAIKNLRQCGTIVAFEMISSESDSYLNTMMGTFTQFCLNNGVFLRSLGNTIYIMPPYCITKKELNIVYEVIKKFIKDHSHLKTRIATT
ncbi:MAG: adenosylmethionine--8-amino-7-oxononanoate transaminase [Ginsengibacter sp.]